MVTSAATAAAALLVIRQEMHWINGEEEEENKIEQIPQELEALSSAAKIYAQMSPDNQNESERGWYLRGFEQKGMWSCDAFIFANRIYLKTVTL